MKATIFIIFNLMYLSGFAQIFKFTQEDFDKPKSYDEKLFYMNKGAIVLDSVACKAFSLEISNYLKNYPGTILFLYTIHDKKSKSQNETLLMYIYNEVIKQEINPEYFLIEPFYLSKTLKKRNLYLVLRKK